MRFVQSNIILYFLLMLLGICGFLFAVIWPQSGGFYTFIVLAAAGGLGVALYIFYTKRFNKQLVCPTGSDCNAVINSKYAKFLNIHLEYWGMLYYGIIFISYLMAFFSPYVLPAFFLSVLALFSTAAFFFSLYLIFVQAFLLRQWCIWCLLSAMYSIAIFIISLANIDFAMQLLSGAIMVIAFMHTFGFVIGMGGATTAIFLFSRFLRDFDINESEAQTLKGISELIWLGLAFVLVSQFANYVAFSETLSLSGLFFIQTVALFVVVISGAIIMIIFAPFLSYISFKENINGDNNFSLAILRKPLFITGAVALASWYYAFIIEYLPYFRYMSLFAIYAAILFFSVLIALFWERAIRKTNP